MPYTPVPAVAAGDWIDEVFINTYWVDNMAAGVPDVFTAKGQLAVGTGVDSMGVLSVGTNGYSLVADSAEALGVKWDSRAKITLFATQPSVTGLTTTVGDQTITATSAISGVPSTAIALFLIASVQWSSVTLFPNLIMCRTVAHNGLWITGTAANALVASSGLVYLNSGTFIKRIISTSPAVLTAYCQGYIE